MHENLHIPSIVTAFDNSSCSVNSARYRSAIYDALKKICPSNLFSYPITSRQRDRFEALIPLVCVNSQDNSEKVISFFALSKYRSNSFRFFFDMVTFWLVPGKRLNVVLVYATDFRLPDVSSDLYTLCEVMVAVEDPQELELIKANFPIIESEVRLGLESSYHARRILEIKGQAADEKMAMVQNHISNLIRRLPQVFDMDLLTEMQHMLITCRNEFRIMRTSRHLSRIITALYLFRKTVRGDVKRAPNQRHLSIKLFKAKLSLPNGCKHVLAVLVTLNFIRDKEVFDKKNILQTIQHLMPSTRAVEGSFFVNRYGSHTIRGLYLEIEKCNGENFSFEELQFLRSNLPDALKLRIAHLVHPVFMPRNEEEVLRHIVSLSNQIKYLRDIPQVVISFDEQTDSDLAFMVILVRVVKPGSETIQALFKHSNSPLAYIHDHAKVVGTFRKKYCKEVTIFRVKLPKEPFLRHDHTLDLNRARQTVVSELCQVIGEFRDFNGGMITKQNELLGALHASLANMRPYDELLLEKFFFSLTPVIMRTLLEVEALTTLFRMLQKAIDKNIEHEVLFWQQDIDFMFALLRVEQVEWRSEIDRALETFQIHSTELARSSVKVNDLWFDGFIYRSDNQSKQMRFLEAITNSIHIPQGFPLRT